MDTAAIIAELEAERDRLNQAIMALRHTRAAKGNCCCRPTHCAVSERQLTSFSAHQIPARSRRPSMNAVCIRQPNGGLQIETRPRPSPGPGELLIRVHACGICHGDLMVQQGAFPFVQYPIVPGHEIAGAVQEIGDGVTGFTAGDRVGLSVLFSSCESCPQCQRGRENLCPTWVWTGMMVNGGCARVVKAQAGVRAPPPPVLENEGGEPTLRAGTTL